MAAELDLSCGSYRLHAQRFGSPEAPLAIGVHGLSGNMKAFDYIGERIAGETLQLLALDLRGRGRSDTTRSGSYGWDAHVRDIFAIADTLGYERFSILGQSMGGSVAMKAAELDGSRFEAVVLLDIAGVPDRGTQAVVAAALSRLGEIHPSADAYIEAIKGQGLINPWSLHWESHYRYELAEVNGGVRSRTSPEAVAEDRAYGATQHPYQRWKHLTMPTLLVRATQEFQPGTGHIVPAADRDRFLDAVPTAAVVEVDANHITVNTHPATADAIRAFLVDVHGY